MACTEDQNSGVEKGRDGVPWLSVFLLLSRKEVHWKRNESKEEKNFLKKASLLSKFTRCDFFFVFVFVGCIKNSGWVWRAGNSLSKFFCKNYKLTPNF